MQLPRASGLLLHPTSLPGRYGIGDLGPEAYAFVDWLAETGQTWWQILPLGPVGYGGSPYQSPSSFAGNPLLISLDRLAGRGWLDARELAAVPDRPADRVDFDAAADLRWEWLRRAFRGFAASGEDPAFEAFREQHRSWLDDYVFFQALRDAHDGQPWYQWEPELVAREPEACARWREQLAEGVRFHEFVQYAFEAQWQDLRAACKEKGIKLIGDVPIFVAEDSADVSAHPELYYLDEHGRPEFMAGVPPDYFSEDGQLWGNPLYRLGGAREGRLRMVVAAAPGAARAGGHHPDRPFPRLRGLLGGARWLEDGGDGPVGPRAGTRVLPRHPQGDGLRAADRRGPRRDHARCRGAARRVRPARHARHAVRLRRGPGLGETPAAPLCQQLRRVHRDARQRHDLRLVPSRQVATTQPREEVEAAHAFARKICQVRRAGDPLGPDPHAVRVGGRHGDRADAGHPRAGQPRPDELPRQGAGELGLAVPRRAGRPPGHGPAGRADGALRPVERAGPRRKRPAVSAAGDAGAAPDGAQPRRRPEPSRPPRGKSPVRPRRECRTGGADSRGEAYRGRP